MITKALFVAAVMLCVADTAGQPAHSSHSAAHQHPVQVADPNRTHVALRGPAGLKSEIKELKREAIVQTHLRGKADVQSRMRMRHRNLTAAATNTTTTAHATTTKTSTTFRQLQASGSSSNTTDTDTDTD